MTSYHILRFDDVDAGSLELVAGNVGAHSAEQAIRAYASHGGEHVSGVYVAVPSRSWKPMTVTVETTTVLTLKEAT